MDLDDPNGVTNAFDRLAEHAPDGYEDYIDDNSTYYYSYGNESFPIPLEDAIFTLPYSITFIVGVIGNVLVMFSIAYYRRMRTTTNVFLFSLASADLLLILICVPVKTIRMLTFSWEIGEFMCKSVFYIQNVSMICSVFTLACISMERVVAVSFPLQARSICTTRRAQVLVVAVWVISFWFAIPIIFIQTHMPVGVRIPSFWCSKEYSYAIGILYEMGMLTLMFILPLTVMTVSYVIICRKIWAVSEMRADMRSGRVIAPVSRQRVRGNSGSMESTLLTTSGDNSGMTHKQDANQDRQTTIQLVIMLVIVVVLFAICWGPVLIDNVLIAFKVVHHLNYGHLKPIRRVTHLLSYINSCVNPIVYAFMSKNFRQSFKYAIGGCIKGQAFVRAYRFSMSLAHTRTSVLSGNGRNNKSALNHRREKSSSSDNEYTQAPTALPEEMELSALAEDL